MQRRRRHGIVAAAKRQSGSFENWGHETQKRLAMQTIRMRWFKSFLGKGFVGPATVRVTHTAVCGCVSPIRSVESAAKCRRIRRAIVGGPVGSRPACAGWETPHGGLRTAARVTNLRSSFPGAVREDRNRCATDSLRSCFCWKSSCENPSLFRKELQTLKSESKSNIVNLALRLGGARRRRARRRNAIGQGRGTGRS